MENAYLGNSYKFHAHEVEISFLKKCISCPPSGQCLISKLCQILCPESEESLIKKLEQTFHEVELETRKKFMSTQWKSLTRKL